jgi:hypothetical protein
MIIAAAALRAMAAGPYETDATVTDNWGGDGPVTVEITGCDIVYQGHIDGARPNSKFTAKLSAGARLLLGEHASVDNNMTGSGDDLCVNARPIYFIGSGLQDTVDHHLAFDADQSGFDESRPAEEQRCGSGGWESNGMSSNYYSGVVYVTRHTRNLPSIHKLAGGSLDHTHHGLLTFIPSNGPVTWIIADNDQAYDGGIRNGTDLTIVAHKHITATGVNHPDAQVNFGSSKSDGGTITKQGSATLYIHGTQAWNPGALMRIEQGSVVFGTDPGAPEELYSTYGIYDPCQCLTLEVGEEGAAELLPGTEIWDAHAGEYLPLEDRNGFASIENRGTIRVGPGVVDIAETMTLFDGSQWRFTRVDNAARVNVGGDLALGGALIVDEVAADGGSHVLIETQGSLSGQFDSHSLPEGVSVSIGVSTVELAFDPTALAGNADESAGGRSTYRFAFGQRRGPAVDFGAGLPESGAALLTVCDPSGRALARRTIRPGSRHPVAIDLPVSAQGVYIVRLDAGALTRCKLIGLSTRASR